MVFVDVGGGHEGAEGVGGDGHAVGAAKAEAVFGALEVRLEGEHATVGARLQGDHELGKLTRALPCRDDGLVGAGVLDVNVIDPGGLGVEVLHAVQDVDMDVVGGIPDEAEVGAVDGLGEVQAAGGRITDDVALVLVQQGEVGAGSDGGEGGEAVGDFNDVVIVVGVAVHVGGIPGEDADAAGAEDVAEVDEAADALLVERDGVGEGRLADGGCRGS